MRTLIAGICWMVWLNAPQQTDPADALLDLLVFYPSFETFDASQLPPGVRVEVDAYVGRLKSFKSRLSVPKERSGEMKMVHAAYVGYERKLAAFSEDAGVPSLAAAYVQKLRPCYEWEGFHDCPQHEAGFADEYMAANPGGPFNAFLTLLSAHRWLCAAEGYAYEKRPQDAANARREYERRLDDAIGSTHFMIPTAAIALSKRGRCFAGR